MCTRRYNSGAFVINWNTSHLPRKDRGFRDKVSAFRTVYHTISL